MSASDPIHVGDHVRLNQGVISQFEGIVLHIDTAKAMAMVEFAAFGRDYTLALPLARLNRADDSAPPARHGPA
jgi:transcription antitermination factor NusG